jgi:hypothetical protein
MGAQRKKDTLPYPSRRISPFAQESSLRSQVDKHSDLRIRDPDTVMAVAADSHRDFLIPERAVSRRARQRGRSPDGLCLFFLHGYYSTRRAIFQGGK